ncbi:hypothetical protein GNI_175670 [Gregarina niphandrodes]|uniref:Uncharacterized protein n=1 Tax=Gregarina niphandrodes TaxID=110365 RepID=A0A023AXJ2_GRENI|nr:hypothetical protein GNI_175670 [Gregarina niphandrodes]EZG43362.1 hypothetical protein GNI_175670 [Gregarina niphandrodes]|eukprot:XP_011134660.1 hypothetical protein GNI_175670 [Gregarina niphandrodes]
MDRGMNDFSLSPMGQIDSISSRPNLFQPRLADVCDETSPLKRFLRAREELYIGELIDAAKCGLICNVDELILPFQKVIQARDQAVRGYIYQTRMEDIHDFVALRTKEEEERQTELNRATIIIPGQTYMDQFFPKLEREKPEPPKNVPQRQTTLEETLKFRKLVNHETLFSINEEDYFQRTPERVVSKDPVHDMGSGGPAFLAILIAPFPFTNR